MSFATQRKSLTDPLLLNEKKFSDQIDFPLDSPNPNLSNLLFQMKTLVPNNTPNIIEDKNLVFNFIEKPQNILKSRKEILINYINHLKSNPNEIPSYLIHIYNRELKICPISLKNFANQEIKEIRKSSLKNNTNNEEFKLERRPIETKKEEIKEKVNKWTEHFKELSQNDNNIRLQNEIRNNLNKLTPDNYHIIKILILNLIKNNNENCQFLVSKIIYKAWTEPKYTKCYAELCYFLQNSKELELDNNSGEKKKKKNIFKSLLLAAIQNSFENNQILNEKSSPQNLNEIKDERKKLFGNVKFIGELYLNNVIPCIIITICSTTLFLNFFQEYFSENGKKTQGENSFEAILILFDLVGKTLELEKVKNDDNYKDLLFIQKIISSKNLQNQTIKFDENFSIKFNQFFSIFALIKENLSISHRLKLLIENLLHKKKSNWKENIISKESPKRIEELHKEYEKEQMEINRRNSCKSPIKNITLIIPKEKIISQNNKSAQLKNTQNFYLEINELRSTIKKLTKKFFCFDNSVENKYFSDKLYEDLVKSSLLCKNGEFLYCFFEEFFNGNSEQVEQLLFIPYKLYTEKIITKQNFLESFSKILSNCWEYTPDNPNLLNYLANILINFIKNKDINVKEMDLCFFEENYLDSEFIDEIFQNYKDFLKKLNDLAIKINEEKFIESLIKKIELRYGKINLY